VSSHDDQSYNPEGSPPGRGYTPSDRAVDWSIRAGQMEARWLRRARPRPFGFAPGSAHPVPERIGEADGTDTLSFWVAKMLGFRVAVGRMSIIYGDAGDPAAPVAEITSAFHREWQHIWDVETELRDAVLKWAELAEAPEAFDPYGPHARGLRAAARANRSVKVTKASIDVVASGGRHRAELLGLGECSAFRVRQDDVQVTVVARHLGPEFPEIVRLTDLEPMISARYRIDREATAAALAKAPALVEELRRRGWSSSTRNQTGEPGGPES
jgi:hypothetical protein